MNIGAGDGQHVLSSKARNLPLLSVILNVVFLRGGIHADLDLSKTKRTSGETTVWTVQSSSRERSETTVDVSFLWKLHNIVHDDNTAVFYDLKVKPKGTAKAQNTSTVPACFWEFFQHVTNVDTSCPLFNLHPNFDRKQRNWTPTGSSIGGG